MSKWPIKYHHKLSDTIKKHNILNQLTDYLKTTFNLTAWLGAELEFYLTSEKFSITEILTSLQQMINHKIKAEKGRNQFEIDLAPSNNAGDYARAIAEIREIVQISAGKLGAVADFRSKPYADDFGSSMHIHLSFMEDSKVEKYAEILCHFIPLTLKFFLPLEEDTNRLDARFMAPTHISYGGNNRTTAIRIPDSAPRRLEHRLAGANADPFLVIYGILNSIIKGLEEPGSITPLAKTFGNAYDPQYGLESIVQP